MGEYRKYLTVFDETRYSSDWPPENLQEAIDWLASKLNEIPAEHRQAAKLEIDTRSEYGEPYAALTIRYSRPETPQEAAEREAARLRAIQQREASQREQYLALKAKFEGATNE